MRTPYLEFSSAKTSKHLEHNPQPAFRYRRADVIGDRYHVYETQSGGVGEIYVCFDDHRNQAVVLKTFQLRHSANPRIYSEIKAEAAKWVALGSHPNIVQCYGVEIIDNLFYLSLEWVTGEQGCGADLRARLHKGPLACQDALQFAIDICEGLQFLIKKAPGLLHRDLKPENVLISGSRVAKITDFGLARFERETGYHDHVITDVELREFNRKVVALAKEGMHGAAGDLERMGFAIGPPELMGFESRSGTPGYRSPEQRNGERLTMQSDIYSFGCMLFEMLLGKTPFEVIGSEDLTSESLESCFANNRCIPDDLKVLLSRCLVKQPTSIATPMELLSILSSIYLKEFNQAPKERKHVAQMSSYDHANRAVAFIHVDHLEDALNEIQQAIKLEPYNPSYCSICGVILDRLGRYNEALAKFDSAIDLDPFTPFLYVNRGFTYHTLNRFEDACRDYDDALRLNPGFGEAFLNRGVTKIKLGLTDEGLADLDRSIQLLPSSSEAYQARGAAFFELEETERALKEYQQAVNLDTGSADALVGRGAALAQMGQFDLALADFSRAIDLDPRAGMAYRNIGVISRRQGKLKQAMSYIVEAARYGDTHARALAPEGFATLADECLSNGDLTGVVDACTKGLEFAPSEPSFYFNRGMAHFSLRQWQEALDDYTAGLSLDPSNSRAYNEKAVIYRRMGKFDAGLRDSETALKLEPNESGNYITHGSICTDLRMYQRALEDFERALELDPTCIAAYINIGALYANTGNLPQAAEYFEKAAAAGDVTGAISARKLRRIQQLQEFPFPHYKAEQLFQEFTDASSPTEFERIVERNPEILNPIFLHSVTSALTEIDDHDFRAALRVRLDHAYSLRKQQLKNPR